MADFSLTTAAIDAPKQNGVDAPELKDEALELGTLERWLLEIKRQPAWRREADKAADYYDGNQLDGELLEILKERGQPELMSNLVAPTIDAVLGMEAKTRTDWIVRGEDGNPDGEEVGEALSMKLKKAENETRADRACSDAYAAQVKVGAGWVEVSRESDPFKPRARVRYVHRREIYWDWRSTEPDLSDARYLVRRRWTDLDIAIAMLPQHAELLRMTTNAWSNFDYIHNTNTGLSRSFEIERETSLDYTDWRDTERDRVCLYEVWYRKPVRGFVLALPNGTNVEYDPENDRHNEAIAAGAVMPKAAVFQRVRVAFYAGPHRLFDIKSPYRHMHFPYVPFFGKREDLTGAPYGLIRAMVSPQDEVNARKSKMLWLLNSRRVIADADAVPDHAAAAREVARPDMYVQLNPNRRPDSKFEVSIGGELATQQFQAMQESKAEIAQSSGIHNPMQGEAPTGITSGVALNSLVEQGTTTLGEINDNFRFSRRLVGELLTDLVKEENSRPNIEVTIGEGDEAKIIVLNQTLPDGTVKNDVRRVNATVQLDDLPQTATFRAQLFQQMSELTKALPEQLQAAVIDIVMEQAPSPGAKEFARRIRKVTGAGQDDNPEVQAAQQAQAQLAQAGAEAEVRGKIAKAEKDMAEAERIRAEIAAGPQGEQTQAVLRRAEERLDDLKLKLAQMTLALEDKTQEIAADRDVRIAVANINARAEVDGKIATATAKVPTDELEARIGQLETALAKAEKEATAARTEATKHRERVLDVKAKHVQDIARASKQNTKPAGKKAA
jgi:hypothetical protein